MQDQELPAGRQNLGTQPGHGPVGHSWEAGSCEAFHQTQSNLDGTSRAQNAVTLVHETAEGGPPQH